MSESLEEYYKALERLKLGKTERLCAGTKICNDAVSLEAGRGKGSIKKSRPGYASLIEDIRAAAIAQSETKDRETARSEKLRKSADEYRALLDRALSREVSLVLEIFQLKRQIAALTGEKILPLRKVK